MLQPSHLPWVWGCSEQLTFAESEDAIDLDLQTNTPCRMKAGVHVHRWLLRAFTGMLPSALKIHLSGM